MPSPKKLSGLVNAEIIEVRFAFSGKLIRVYKRPGDQIKKGEILASLDRKTLQMELDQELADFERVRAEFEIFNLHNPNPGTDIIKYEKAQKQAFLNSAVKSVEIAKYRLDSADMVSPVTGIIISDGGLRTGLYVTPGANPFSIWDMETLSVNAEIEWKDVAKFPVGTQVKIEILDQTQIGTVLPFIPPLKGTPFIRVSLSDVSNISPGLPGRISS